LFLCRAATTAGISAFSPAIPASRIIGLRQLNGLIDISEISHQTNLPVWRCEKSVIRKLAPALLLAQGHFSDNPVLRPLEAPSSCQMQRDKEDLSQRNGGR
jgi:hypothetical protein